jgi:hypothetical protein
MVTIYSGPEIPIRWPTREEWAKRQRIFQTVSW